MTVFLIASAVLTALAVAFAVLPWLRGAPGEQRARLWPALALAVAVPLAAAALYLRVGTPDGLDPAAAGGGEGGHAMSPDQMAALVSQLAERLKSEPDNVDGWVMLARSYRSMGRFKESAEAFKAVVARVPDDANLLLDYADMLAMAQGRDLRGEPEALVARALRLDPENPKGVAMSATLAFDRGEYARAAALWESLLPRLPADSPFAGSLRQSAAEARQRAGMPPLAAAGTSAAPAAPQGSGAPSGNAGTSAGEKGGSSAAKSGPLAGGSPASAAGAGAVTGSVRLAPALAGRVSPDDPVFVIARTASGGPPLAVLRRRGAEIPFEFRLDDAAAMNPGALLSQADQIVVVARVAKGGGPSRQPGDLEGTSAPVRPGTGNLVLEISRVVE